MPPVNSVLKLRRAEELGGVGKANEEIAAELELSAATLYWRRAYGGMDLEVSRRARPRWPLMCQGVWALDFQKPIKIASMLDEHTRESLLNIVERSITRPRPCAVAEQRRRQSLAAPGRAITS